MIEIETAGERRSQWGEGAIWWGGRLYYVDIEGKAVIEFDPATGNERTWDVGERVGTVVPRIVGGLVIAGDHGFHFLDPGTGETTPIGDPEPDKADNRFNDGKCAPDGYFFAGTISLVKKEGDARLYRLGPDLECREVFGPVTNSNGLAWSADGGTMFYIDTPRREVMAFAYQDGLISGRRTVIDTGAIDASPDGMTMDADGNLWIAFCHGGCVVCFDPRTGEEVRRVDLPCLETTSCAFGGPGLSDLYVTTGIHKSVEEEHGGRLLVVRGLGVHGLASFAFGG